MAHFSRLPSPVCSILEHTDPRLLQTYSCQPSGIRSGEVASFARNENDFDVCTTVTHLLFVLRGKELSFSNRLLECRGGRNYLCSRLWQPDCRRHRLRR